MRAFVELFQASRQHLENSVCVFRKIGDTINIALLSCNLAKLCQLLARALAPAEKKRSALPSGNVTQTSQFLILVKF
jgi:hypothetical protein